MTCPICDAAFERADLLPSDDAGDGLRGFRCPRGHGLFLPSDRYHDWRDGRDLDGAPTPDAAPADDVGDVKKAKLCPQDGRIMGRYRAGAGADFWIDRCASCGGVWFDGSEWDATVAAGLHRVLPRIFTDDWQLAAEDALAAGDRRARLLRTVGEEDLNRADAFRDWVWAHAERHLLLARVNEPPPEA